MAETFNIDKLLEEYTVGSSSSNKDWMKKLPQKKTVTKTTEINVDNYYNYYGIMTPNVEVSFLHDKGKDLNGKDAVWTNLNGDDRIRQNNYFVSATITDNGSRTLNLTLFDRSFYQVQGLIFQAIKAGGGREEKDIVNTKESSVDIKDGSGERVTSLNFVYQPNNMIVNNLRVKWGYAEENPTNERTKELTNDNYFNNINSPLSTHRWNERTGFDSKVLRYDENGKVGLRTYENDKGEEIITRGSYEEILNQSNQSTVRSCEEYFFITNVESTLTDTGMRYNITAIGVDNFILNGFKFVQMYAQLKGTAKELMGFFMKSFNENDKSLVRVVWNDDKKLQNGTEFVKNYDGKYIEREKAEGDEKEGAYERREELNKLLSIAKNTMAVLRKDDSQSLEKDFFGNNKIEYDVLSEGLDKKMKLEAEATTNLTFEEKIDFISITSPFLGGSVNDDKKYNLSDENKEKVFLDKAIKNYSKISRGSKVKKGSGKTKISIYNLQKIYLYAIENSISEIPDFELSVEVGDSVENLDNYQKAAEEIEERITNIKNSNKKISDIDWDEPLINNRASSIRENLLQITDNLKKEIEAIDKRDKDEGVSRDYLEGLEIKIKDIENLKSLEIQKEVARRKAANYFERTLNSYTQGDIKDYFFNLAKALAFKEGSLGTVESYSILKDKLWISIDNEKQNIEAIKNKKENYSKSLRTFGYEIVYNFAKKILNFYEKISSSGGEDYPSGILGEKFTKYYYGSYWIYENGTLSFVESGGKTLEEITLETFNSFKNKPTDDYEFYIRKMNTENPYYTWKLYDKGDIILNNDETMVPGNIDSYEDIQLSTWIASISEHLTEKLEDKLLERFNKYLAEPIKKNNINVKINWNSLSVKGTVGKLSGKLIKDKVKEIFDKAKEAIRLNNKPYINKVEDIEDLYKELLPDLNQEITNVEETIQELEAGDQKAMIKLTLGGEEAKNNYSDDKSVNNPIYYKTVSSLFSSYTSQCPSYKTHNDSSKNSTVEEQTYKSVDENGNEIVSSVETNNETYRLTWSVIGLDGERPIVGFYYDKPKKQEYLRVYNWGNGNSKQHAIKNLSIQTSSEFGMLNMAAIVNKDTGEATSNNSNEDKTYKTSEATSYFSGGAAFVSNVVNNNAEAEALVDKMTNGIKQGSIEILGDPSLRFQGDITPYTYPIKIDIKLQKDGSWSDGGNYIPCQLSGYYVVSKITHNISSSGYTTTLEVMSYPGLKEAAIA